MKTIGVILLIWLAVSVVVSLCLGRIIAAGERDERRERM